MPNRPLETAKPFRLFFPLGFVAGCLGVAIWPLYHWKILSTCNTVAHAKIQIQGFIAPFAIGFLLTALPRMMEVSPCTYREAGILFLGALSVIGLHWYGFSLQGDLVCLGNFLFLIGILATRFPSRKDMPPPFFGIIFMAFVHAISGLTFTILSGWGWTKLYTLGKDLMNQGFILCLILGVGSFLIPRFLGHPESKSFPESKTPPPGWWKEAFRFLGMGLILYLSFWLQHGGFQKTGEILRAALITGMLFSWMHIHKKPKALNYLAVSVRLSMFLTLIGLWGALLFPQHRIAMLHILFIGGFGLITLLVSVRVSYGHGGYDYLFKTPLTFTAWIAGFLVIAILFRLLADFYPNEFFRWLTVGSVFWLLGIMIWGCFVLPKVFLPREDG